MKTYMQVAIYDMDGNFQGYAIRMAGIAKLQSTNLYVEGEEQQLEDQLQRLNSDVDLRAHWPHPQDPEVQALLDDEEFMPVGMIRTEVIDEDNSYLVYKKIAGTGVEEPTWVDSDEVDEEASVLVFKEVLVPAKPTDTMWRIKKACEQVARQRASLV